MPEKAPTTADFSLLSSLPPPTSEIVTDKIPHTPEKCQLKPTTPSGKNLLPSMGGARNFAGTALKTSDVQQCEISAWAPVIYEQIL